MNSLTKKEVLLKEGKNLILTVIGAMLSAFGLHVFVYPFEFAPSGIDGIATMLQEVTGVNAGIYTLLLNLPLLIAAYFILKKRYVIYTVIFILMASGMLMGLEAMSFYQFSTDTDMLIPAIFSGVILGVRTGLMLKIGACAGGVDIIACIIQKKKSHLNVERLITIFCYITIIISYFVYNSVTSILLAVVQMYVFEIFAGSMLKDKRNAIEFKIITKHPEEIKNDIIFNLKHGATVLEGKGMYTDEESSVIISVINIRQVPEFLEIIKKHPDTFAYYGELTGVRGNFRWEKDDEAV